MKTQNIDCVGVKTFYFSYAGIFDVSITLDFDNPNLKQSLLKLYRANLKKLPKTMSLEKKLILVLKTVVYDTMYLRLFNVDGVADWNQAVGYETCGTTNSGISVVVERGPVRCYLDDIVFGNVVSLT